MAILAARRLSIAGLDFLSVRAGPVCRDGAVVVLVAFSAGDGGESRGMRVLLGACELSMTIDAIKRSMDALLETFMIYRKGDVAAVPFYFQPGPSVALQTGGVLLSD